LGEWRWGLRSDTAFDGAHAPETGDGLIFHMACAGFPFHASAKAKNMSMPSGSLGGKAVEVFVSTEVLQFLCCPACLVAAMSTVHDADEFFALRVSVHAVAILSVLFSPMPLLSFVQCTWVTPRCEIPTHLLSSL
jgi:hypothetical protein